MGWNDRPLKCLEVSPNYTVSCFPLQVSVRRNVPSISDGFLQDQPEDWASAFSEVFLSFFLIKTEQQVA